MEWLACAQWRGVTAIGFPVSMRLSVRALVLKLNRPLIFHITHFHSNFIFSKVQLDKKTGPILEHFFLPLAWIRKWQSFIACTSLGELFGIYTHTHTHTCTRLVRYFH